ncbi:UNVERIFIED_CONTAM: hypothetical protein FKN15_028121 [Acipenser sinensis]
MLGGAARSQHGKGQGFLPHLRLLEQEDAREQAEPLREASRARPLRGLRELLPPLLHLLSSTAQSLPCAQASTSRPCSPSSSPHRGRKRSRWTKQEQQITALQKQMTQVIELLARQQAPPASTGPLRVDPPAAAPEAAQQVEEMSIDESDALSIARGQRRGER